jgi:hypothetical protein
MEDKNYLYIADALYDELEKCSLEPGADIKVSITRRGITKEYPLYDHATLVQGLMEAIDKFISEQ